MSDFVMPSLGADMESGKLVQWLVKPGSVIKGAKGLIPIPAPKPPAP